jgi:hypothetical protein
VTARTLALPVVIVSVVGLGVVIVSRFVRTTETATEKRSDHEDDLAQLRDDTSRELQRLRQELRARDQFWQELANTREPQGPSPTMGEGSAGKEPPEAPDLDKEQTAAKRAQQVLAERLAAEFSKQGSDPAWSKRAEEQARLGIAQHLGPGTTLGNLKCHQTLCQISSSHRDRAAFMDFAREVLAGRDTGLWNAAVAAFVTREDSTSVEAVAYVTREGHPLPQSN